jgi:hypothetical protein
MEIERAKQEARHRTWALLEQEGAVKPPGTAVGKIPNFLGAEAAAEQLATQPLWQTARVLKANPDKAQRAVRAKALAEGKVLYVAVPRLADDLPFYLLDPEDLCGSPWEAASKEGAARAASRWVRISGMTCSVLPIRDSQPHWQLARRWPRSARAAGLTVTLCPATCSLTETVTAHSDRWVMAEPTHVGSGSPNWPLGSWHVLRRGRLGHAKARAGADRSARRWAPRAMVVPKVGERGKVSSPPVRVTMAGEGTREGLAAVPPCVAARAGFRLPPKAAPTAGPPSTRPRRMDQSREAHHPPLHSPEGATPARVPTRNQ